MASRLHQFAAATVFALSVAIAVPSQAASFSSLVVFGDSLSDSGNNAALGLFDPLQVVTGNTYVPSNTYAPVGTYSNGPVWASYFAAALGVPLAPSFAGGTNFAAGGATTGTDGGFMLPNPPFPPIGFPYSLRSQTGLYLGATGGAADPNALYVVAGGGNNARAGLNAIFGGANPFAVAGATAFNYADDVGDIVDSLQAAGAQHIVVWNTPNLALAPAVAAGGPAAQGAGTLLASVMNGALGARLAGEAGVTTFDLFGFGVAVAANPAAFGFTNNTDACGAVLLANCNQYVYWDGIHPTSAAHRVIAGRLADQLDIRPAIPEPQTYALMLLGLVAVGTAARRRKTLS